MTSETGRRMPGNHLDIDDATSQGPKTYEMRSHRQSVRTAARSGLFRHFLQPTFSEGRDPRNASRTRRIPSSPHPPEEGPQTQRPYRSSDQFVKIIAAVSRPVILSRLPPEQGGLVHPPTLVPDLEMQRE